MTAPLSNLSREAQDELEQIGKSWAADVTGHVKRVVDIYSPVLAAAPPTTATIFMDVSYGPHERHLMDIYQPVAGNKPADVLIFLHGGAFVRGAKRINDELYENVCRWFADRGVLAVNLEYRLAGDAPFPSGAQDVASAVDFMALHAADYGGDPTRIFVMGHSAGGTHVASYAYDHHLGANGRPLLSDAVRGVLLVSARLRADVRTTNPNAYAVRAYYGDDESLYETVSPVTHAAGSQVPTMIVIAQYENPHLETYGAELFHRLLQGVESPDGIITGPMPRFVQLMKHNHISTAAHFNSGEDTLGLQMLEFMQACIP